MNRDDGSDVRRFRQEKGWTQREAAAWYGCTPRAWQYIEAGQRPVPVPLVRAIERERIVPRPSNFGKGPTRY